jgi:hypothetical protein
MQPTVDIKTVMSQLMERLSKYVAASPDVCHDTPTHLHTLCLVHTLTKKTIMAHMGWNGVQVLQEFLQVEAFSKFSHSVVEVSSLIIYVYTFGQVGVGDADEL